MVRSPFAWCALTQLLAACATVPIARDTDRPSTAIYLPPSTLGGQGSILFLPASTAAKLGKASASLEAPDATSIEATADWLVGIWLFASTPDDVDRLACNSGVPERFDEDGTWDWFYGEGSWELRDGVLTKTALSTWDIGPADEQNDEETSDGIKIGKSYSNRIKRVGPDEGAVFEAGAWQPMLRCRRSDFNVTLE